MKHYSLILPIFLLAAQLAIAQDNPFPRQLTYKILISDPEMRQIKGYLLDLTDTTLKLSHWPVRFGNDPALKEGYKEIMYRKISVITLQRSHGAGRGAWKGAIVGLLIGVAAGFIEGDDPEEYWFRFTAADKALIYGGLGAAAGTGIGALIGGLVKKRFIIGGRKENFDAMKMNVLNKVYGVTASTLNSQ
jgi:hypothetical protein